jgi:hypothetical protein
MVPVEREGREWCATRELPDRADAVNSLSQKMNTTQENGELLVASKEVRLEVNAEGAEFMCMPLRQNG